MSPVDRERAYEYVHILSHAAFVIFVVFFAVLVVWIITSRPNAKLYEADNVVCVSQPFSSQCFDRKPH